MNITLARIPGVFSMLVLNLAGADRAAASYCPIDTSSPTAQFSVNTYVFGYSGTPVCGTLEELPILDTYAGGGEHYMECVSKIERPGEILHETYATGNGYGSNNHIVHSAWIHLGDVVISGGPDATISGALNLFYGGDQISCAAANSARCYTGRSFWTRVNGGGYYTFDYVWGIYETGSVPLTGLPVGTPFNLNIEIRQTNDALAFTTGSQRWTGFVQFLPSQVFNLPVGYTVNSTDGRIVDNQWCAEFVGPDFDRDCDVDVADLQTFANWWLAPGCDVGNAWCGYADLSGNGFVDLQDFSIFADQWLEQMTP